MKKVFWDQSSKRLKNTVLKRTRLPLICDAIHAEHLSTSEEIGEFLQEVAKTVDESNFLHALNTATVVCSNSVKTTFQIRCINVLQVPKIIICALVCPPLSDGGTKCWEVLDVKLIG